MTGVSLDQTDFDAVIIGGGFYGAVIAIYLASRGDFRRILLVERETGLMLRASYNNQARVHNGYHYPRSFTTAYRSRVNFPKFLRDWPDVINTDFTKLYAIARRNSKVTAKQFERFCHNIGASIRPADSSLKKMFESHLIEDVFQVEECAFDTTKLACWAERELKRSGVKLMFGACVTEVSRERSTSLSVVVQSNHLEAQKISSHFVFNCTYSGINQLKGGFTGIQSELKQEITEMALVQVPDPLEGLGITVMDGPFFSMMPFPARGLHTLSHVRYTPHTSWSDRQGLDPYEKLRAHEKNTRFERMIRDVARYIPLASNVRFKDSLFEVKTVLVRNEVDDGRPILFEPHPDLAGCYSIMGGKIDNVYDVIERLEDEIKIL